MDNKVQAFLAHQRVGVIGIAKQDGTPHSATMHYAHSENPFRIYLVTEKDSKKCGELLDGLSAGASFVAGFSEEEWTTFQAEGGIHMPRGDKELSDAKAAYYLKYPAAQANEYNKKITFLIFTPKWWRYTNLNPEPWEIISSEE